MLLICTLSMAPIPSPRIFPPLESCSRVVHREKTQTTYRSTVRLPIPSIRTRLSRNLILGAPTLYYVKDDTYTEIYPATFKTYYEDIDRAEIPFPLDLHMVAGNASAKTQSDVDEKITAMTWWCDTGADDRNSRPRAAFPRSTCSAHMQAILRFPNCVNPDKVTEYAYAAASPGGKCPSGMKRIPSLRFSVRYNTKAAIPGGWSGIPPFKLACGEVSALFRSHGHVYFIRGWMLIIFQDR